MVSLPNHPDQTATAAVTRGTIRVVLAMLVMGSCVLGCSRPAPKSTIEIPCSFTGRCQVPMGRYGIACVIAPGNSYPSYSADSIGKPGVPELSKYQKAIIRRIQFRTKSRSIRFVPSRQPDVTSGSLPNDVARKDYAAAGVKMSPKTVTPPTIVPTTLYLLSQNERSARAPGVMRPISRSSDKSFAGA